MTRPGVNVTLIGSDVREGLGRLVDLLLPGTDRLPAGRAVGAHSDLLDRVLNADPTLAPVVVELGRRAAETPSFGISDVQSWSEDGAEALAFSLTAAYYMSPDVLRALGYPGQQRRPIAQATADEVCSEELLAPVRDRGAIYIAVDQ